MRKADYFPAQLGIMFRTAPLLPVSLTLCCLGFVLALVTVDSDRPTRGEWRQAIERAAAEHVPINARPCGTVELREDPSAAQACVKAAIDNSAPFWVLSQAQGYDSVVWSLSEGADRYKAVEFDSYGWEQQGRPAFSAHEVSCSSPHFGEYASQPSATYYEPAIWCNRR